MKYFLSIIVLCVLINFNLFSQNDSSIIETVVQTGHYGAIYDADFSPDGKLIVTAAADNTIIMWEVETGRQLKTFIGHTNVVTSVKFSPDGKELIAVDENHKAIQWNILKASIIREIVDSTDEIRSAIYSPKGNYILTGGHKTNAILWDRATGKKIKTFSSKPEVCYQCAPSLIFSPDEKKVYTSSENNNILIWDIQKNDTLKTLRFAKGNCSSCNSYISLSPDGTKLAMADYSGDLFIIDAQTHKILKQLTSEEEDFYSVQFHKSGDYLITKTDYYGTIKIWDIKTGKVTREIKDENNKKIKVASFSPDGKYILIAGEDKKATLWQFQTNKKEKEFDGVVTKINDKNLKDRIYYISQLTDTKMSNDGKLVAQCKRGNEIIIWDFFTGKAIKSIMNDTIISCIDFSPDNEYIAAADVEGVVKIINIKNGKIIKSFKAHGGTVFVIRYSKDGKYIITGGWDSSVNIWEVTTGKRYSHYTIKNGSPFALNFTVNGLYGLGASNLSDDTKVKITEFDTGIEIKSLIGHTDLIQSIEINPAKENEALTASFDGTARIWNIETGFQIRKLIGHKTAVHVATYSSDGEYIITGSRDKTAKLWNAKTGELIRTFKGHTGAVNYAQITPDNKYLLTASRDHTVKIWDIKTGKLLITHVTFENKQWIAKSEAGYFEGTPEALKKLYFVKDAKTYSLDQFFEKLYKPGVYKKSLAMEVEQQRGIDVGKLINESSPPIVEILAPQNGKSKDNYKEVIIKVTNTGGGINEVCFLQNGKRIEIPNKLSRSLPKKDQDIILSYNISLVPGLNSFSISAYSDGRVESKPKILELTYEGTKKTSDLYILAIGINEYQNPVMSLNYAKADAEAFVNSMQEKSKELFNKIEVIMLLDKEATQAAIYAKLNEIKQKATKEDVFYFYYAGHGSAIQQEFYFVPYECVSLYQEEKLIQEAIAATQLNLKLREINALKQVVILDACQSGASTNILAARGVTEEKALAQLARSSGIHIMAAAGSEQQAIEFNQLGHGLFTYVLLEALNGKADGAPNDKKVTVYELKSFIDDQVPELSKQYQGQSQYPSTFSLGQDFPMVITEIEK